LEGEARSRTENKNTIVARTGFVFGPRGNNFLSKIVERAGSGHTISAINDAYGTPTYARDLAVRLRELGQQNHPGIYHVVNAGDGVTFEEFAKEALKIAGYRDVEIVSVSMDELKRPAARPRNSRLRCILSPEIGLPAMRDWRVGLRDFVERETNRSLAV
ncbi:MAG TPA: sugar nucleotide-binding protein, partial [Pyrinomonadaceae bacterium]|nr:sugar nucleotide-binding protein [Pyrinomonadaceae bacterium]